MHTRMCTAPTCAIAMHHNSIIVCVCCAAHQILTCHTSLHTPLCNIQLSNSLCQKIQHARQAGHQIIAQLSGSKSMHHLCSLWQHATQLHQGFALQCFSFILLLILARHLFRGGMFSRAAYILLSAYVWHLLEDGVYLREYGTSMVPKNEDQSDIHVVHITPTSNFHTQQIILYIMAFIVLPVQFYWKSLTN